MGLERWLSQHGHFRSSGPQNLPQIQIDTVIAYNPISPEAETGVGKASRLA